MKVAIYLRVSRIDLHPENQLLELERYAKAFGWEYDIFEEKESTRKTRPIKNKIFQEAISKKYDMVLVYKMDRWARSLSELMNDFNLFRIHNVQFRSIKDNIILDDDPRNMLMIHILGAFAEFEREIIRERTIAGLARVRAQGKILGRPSKDGTKYENPNQDDVKEMVAKGVTIRDIAEKLGTSKYRVEMVIKNYKKNPLSNLPKFTEGMRGLS